MVTFLYTYTSLFCAGRYDKINNRLLSESFEKNVDKRIMMLFDEKI